MPRTNSRKRNNHRNAIPGRVSAASNLSAEAPEFIPIGTAANDESNTENQIDNLPLQSITFYGSSSTSNSGNDCNSTFSDTTNNSTPDVLTNRGQRDLLINLLNNSKVDCVICYERTTNEEHVWNCRSCFQIMHLKCVMVWFIKSHSNSTWRCPACQSNVVGKPSYVCFCGSLRNPFSNKMDTPHSCGQVCGLPKKNTNSEYDNCQHKCTLLCHPGPCPQCVVQVLRNCGCGKTATYAQCGQSTPILCQNTCSKLLDCRSHICEKKCHSGKCDPCKKPCTQWSQLVIPHRSPQRINLPNFPAQDFVTAEELRMLGLDPDELFQRRSNQDIFYLNDYNEYMSGDDDDLSIDNDDDMNDIESSHMYEQMWLDVEETNVRFRRYRLAVNPPLSNSRDTVENGSVTSNDSSISSVVSATSASNSSNNTHNSSDYNTYSSRSSNSMSTSNSEDIDVVGGYSADGQSDSACSDDFEDFEDRPSTDQEDSNDYDEIENSPPSGPSVLFRRIDYDLMTQTSYSEDSTDNSQSSHSLSHFSNDSSSDSSTTTDTSSSS